MPEGSSTKKAAKAAQAKKPAKAVPAKKSSKKPAKAEKKTAMASMTPAKAANKMAATTIPVTPAKAEKLSKKKEEKLKRYKVKLKTHLKGCIWVLCIIDTKCNKMMPIDHKWATKVFKKWLKEFAAQNGRPLVTVYSFDSEGDPVEMYVQIPS